MFRIFVTVLLLALSFTSESKADPSASVTWLMNEPASLFDLGLTRLRIRNTAEWTPALMNALEGKNLKLGELGVGSVVYNFDENTITISAPLIGNPTEEICSEAIKEYKKIIIPPVSNQKLKFMLMVGEFGHINYASKSRPEDLDENICKLFIFTVGISNKSRFGTDRKSIFCSERINDTTPSISKYGFK